MMMNTEFLARRFWRTLPWIPFIFLNVAVPSREPSQPFLHKFSQHPPHRFW